VHSALAGKTFPLKVAELIEPSIAKVWALAVGKICSGALEGTAGPTSSAPLVAAVGDAQVDVGFDEGAFDREKFSARSQPPEFFTEVVKSLEGDLTLKIKRLADKMALNADWLGARCKIDVEIMDSGPIESSTGFSAFAATVARNALRIGPAACPLPVAAFFAMPVAHDVFFIFWSAEAIPKQGVALAGAKAFLSGESAEAFIKDSENLVAIYAPKGPIIRVPWGWLPQPVFYFPGQKNKDCDAFQRILHIPIMIPERA
ncbi:unnamed protein product, partial [Prorocentrum cordatum]